MITDGGSSTRVSRRPPPKPGSPEALQAGLKALRSAVDATPARERERVSQAIRQAFKESQLAGDYHHIDYQTRLEKRVNKIYDKSVKGAEGAVGDDAGRGATQQGGGRRLSVLG